MKPTAEEPRHRKSRGAEETRLREAASISQQLLERLAEHESRPGQHRALAEEYCALTATEREAVGSVDARVRSLALGFALVERAKELLSGDRAEAKQAAQLALTLVARHRVHGERGQQTGSGAVVGMDVAAAACAVLAEGSLLAENAEEGSRHVLAAETYLALGSGDPNLHAEVAAAKALLLWRQGDGEAAATLLGSAARLLAQAQEPALEATMHLRHAIVLESLGLREDAGRALARALEVAARAGLSCLSAPAAFAASPANR